MSKTKKTTARDVAYRIIVLCLIGIILVSGYNIGKTLLEYRKARSEYNAISEIALVDPLAFTGDVAWDALLEINPDVVGWIFLNDSVINYPVAKGADNDEYLHRLIDGTYNFAGTIFVDCSAEDDFQGYNTVIYGHHMKDGSMFAPLAKFVNDSGWFGGHPVFELVTPSERYHLQVFAAFVTDASSSVYDMRFSSPEAFMAHVDMLRNYSVITADDVTVTPDDRIVTLSTCVDAEGEARYVVICKVVPW